METSKGSFAFTDAGINVSTRITDRLRVGAQLYVRNIGHLGDWHPTLDWAFADYQFKDWFGIRAGKVKTALGLYNDTQDMDFLHTFALLPQSVYPTDLRDATIAHAGGDIYGNIAMKKAGTVAYTVYAGHRQDTMYGGYIYLLRDRGINMTDYGGLQYGADLRWNTPLPGVMIGASHMREEIDGSGTATCNPGVPFDCQDWLARANPSLVGVSGVPMTGKYWENSNKDQTNLGYAEVTVGNLKLDGEYRRYWRDQNAWDGMLQVKADTRGWYLSGSYRLSKRFELGSYYSRFTCMWQRGANAPLSNDIDLPDHHVFDKVITGRVDLTPFWNVKVEGHFMDGYGGNQSPSGFYTPVNPQGLKPKTNLLLVRTGWYF